MSDRKPKPRTRTSTAVPARRALTRAKGPSAGVVKGEAAAAPKSPPQRAAPPKSAAPPPENFAPPKNAAPHAATTRKAVPPRKPAPRKQAGTAAQPSPARPTTMADRPAGEAFAADAMPEAVPKSRRKTRTAAAAPGAAVQAKSPRAARFAVGDVVRHRFYPFRGVIFDIDPVFANTEEWWLAIPEQIRPAKDQPFYHLLAENAETEYVAYVSEQNLLPDNSGRPLRHPRIRELFEVDEDGTYRAVYFNRH